MSKTTPWLKIKAEYLQGATPAELAKKYDLTAKQISDKATKNNWVVEKSEICVKVREKAEDKIERYTNDAIEVLHDVMNDSEAKNADKVSAARAILDVSGLKSSKQQITGADGEPLGIQKIFITPEQYKEAKDHIYNTINE